jgi:hypothetical protein
VTGGTPTQDMTEGRAMVMHRALDRCEVESPVCTHDTPHWHHRQSRRTGIHGPHNGLAACPPCHAYIHTHPRQALDMGWIINTWTDDPETAPAKVRGRWVTLTKGGTYA